MVRSLNKKWKEVVYALTGFGPNLLMVLMGAFFTDAINPAAMGGGSYQVISGACYILPAIFPILYAIAKAFDGFIDIPFAHVADTLKSKFGRSRTLIAIFALPMIVSFAMCWLPIGGEANPTLNTVWIIIWALIFFATYTMAMIAFYGSLSTTCENEHQRTRVSSYKSFFDTISYCIVYALVPMLLDLFKVHIDKFVFICLPLMLTILIPLFVVKEGKKYGYPEDRFGKTQKVGFIESIKMTFKNKNFTKWLIVNGCSFFGLQMFLTAMNSMIVGGMGFNGLEMALINTCAFAPVPIMLYFFSKMKSKKGLRFTYQTCLAMFGLCILGFFFSSLFMTGGNKMIQYIIGCVGGIFGSWGIGAFFMASYLVPTQIASAEEKVTGKNHSAMFFAAQAVVTSIIGALASSLVYENIKMLFISKSASGIVWAKNITEAATKFGVAESSVFNLGTLIVPFIVCLMCFIGLVFAFRMPKDYNQSTLAKDLLRKTPQKENIIVEFAVGLMSAGILGFYWPTVTFSQLSYFKLNKLRWLHWALCCFVPFYSAYYLVKLHKEMKNKFGNEVKLIGHEAIYITLSILFPILPINLIALAILQRNTNKIIDKCVEEEEIEIPEEILKEEKVKEKGEVVFVQVALSILSGFIFGFFWPIFTFKRLSEMKVVSKRWLHWALCAFVPFYSIYFLAKTNKKIKALCKEKGVKYTGHIALDIIFGIMFPILPLNVVSLSILQHNTNKLIEKANEEEIKIVEIGETQTQGANND